MKENSLLKIFLLFTGILSIFALCPGYPTIPTTSIPKSSPLVLTSASKGVESVTNSAKEMTISMVVTLDEECPEEIEVFEVNRTKPDGNTEKKVAGIYVDCDTFNVYVKGNALSDTQTIDLIWTGTNRTLNLVFSLDLENSYADLDIRSLDLYASSDNIFDSTPSYTFDETTKIYLCSDMDGAASALSCTISQLQLIPVYPDYWINVFADFTPVSQAFYPLTDGKLTSLINTEDSAYFGDSASSPSTGTSPSFDSTNSFVKFTSATQFLTFPLVSVSTKDPIFLPTMTLAMWVRVTSAPTTSDATIFSLYSDNDGELFSLNIKKDTNELNIVSWVVQNTPTDYSIPLNTWQLISLTVYPPPYTSDTDYILYVGDAFMERKRTNFGDLSALKLRVGDAENSFIGDLSTVRMLSPGIRFFTFSDTCSSDIDVGFDPYALSCSSSASFNPYDNKCYSSCSGDTVTPTDGPLTLCLSENIGKPSSPITIEESGGGLSGGAIAGIVIGSVAVIAVIAAVGYFVKIKAAKNAKAPKRKPVDNEKTPREGIVPKSNIASPTAVEEIPLR